MKKKSLLFKKLIVLTILFIGANAALKAQIITLGNSSNTNAGVDGWKSNLVINETDTYTNNSGSTESLQIDEFSFYANKEGDPVTPFVVKVNGDNNFTVLAVGTSRTSTAYNVGQNTVAFNDGAAKLIPVANGEKIAIGFLDANSDGSGGSSGAVIAWESNAPADQIWYTGGAASNNSGSVSEGAAPTGGLSTLTNLNRNYHFNIKMSKNNGSCDLPYSNNGVTCEQQTVNWTSGAIDISCATSVDISLKAVGTGAMEDADYLNIYYKVDGGGQVTILENVNTYTSQTLTANNLSGNSLEIIVKAYTSYTAEVYTVSNISVTEGSSDPVAVTGVAVSSTSETLNVGGTVDLNATVAPVNATNKTVSWSSNKTNVATVNSSTGLVTAVAEGNATITVTTQDGNKTAACSVTVNSTSNGVNTVSCASIPSTIESKTSYTFSIPFEASESRDVAVEFWEGGVWKKNAKTTVNAGSGTASVTVNLNAAPANGASCLLKVAIRPVGTTYTSNLNNCESTMSVDGGTPTGNPKVLFVVGANGTVGFLEGWGNDQKASINDYSTSNGNHGWGQWSDILRNNDYELTEVTEGANGVNFTGMNLSQYNMIVFGSNNANYAANQVTAVINYIKAGGGALFISDGNFGKNWRDASDSDQQFVNYFGWTMNQDMGTYHIYSGDFVNGGHRILQGVSSYDGEGVTPITLSDNGKNGITTSRLAPAKGSVRRNNGNPGSSSSANGNDATILAASVGSGRVIGFFDRNTFFNSNGAGSNIHKGGNKTLALNMYGWLCQKDGFKNATAQSITEGNYNNFKVYPNPFNYELNIALDTDHNFNSVQVVDMLGRVVHNEQINGQTDLIFNIDIPSGVYFVQLISENDIKVVRVLKK